MSKINLVNITKSWGSKRAVDDLSLTIEDGELLALLGPSGCGKSTSLMMLAGLYAPSNGDILFDDIRVNEIPPQDRNVGIVFQSYALYPNLSVQDNILFPLRFKGRIGASQRQKCREIADLVEIGDLLDRKPSELSGGQQQRVALARALIKAPNLLLLDEPLSNLDAALRLTMRTEIKKIQRELNVTTILVTHDQLEATTMADRIVCMRDGRIEQQGSADDLYVSPATSFIAKFIGSPAMTLLSGICQNGIFQSDSAQAGQHNLRLGDISWDGPLLLGCRPEQILFAEQGLPGRILSIEPMGREILYAVMTDIGVIRVLEPGVTARYRIEESCHLQIDPAQCHLFDPKTTQRLSFPAGEAV